jgi:hypothetical protein
LFKSKYFKAQDERCGRRLLKRYVPDSIRAWSSRCIRCSQALVDIHSRAKPGIGNNQGKSPSRKAFFISTIKRNHSASLVHLQSKTLMKIFVGMVSGYSMGVECGPSESDVFLQWLCRRTATSIGRSPLPSYPGRSE